MRRTRPWSPERHPRIGWRATLTLSCYRVALSFSLFAILVTGHGQVLFAASDTGPLFRGVALVYLLLAVGLTLAALGHWPRLDTHVFTGTVVDVACLLLLSYAGSGASGSFAILLLAPLVGAGVLLPARLGGLLAALGSLGLIGQELMRLWLIPDALTHFFQSGLLGALYFAAAILAYMLARRIRISDASALAHARQARHLAHLNQLIIDRIQTGAIVADGHNRLQTCNQAALDLLGRPSPPETPEQLEALSPALAAELTAWRTGRNPPGAVEMAGNPVLLNFKTLGDLGDSILICMEDARRAREQAQQMKLASLGRLTASIAHEIRNPLGAISHSGQLLAESPRLADEDNRLLGIIERHSQRINRIVADVLGLARYSEQPPETLELHGWLLATISDYRESRRDTPLISIDRAPEPVQIRFNPDQLRQVLFNLWDNSNRHARTGAGQAPAIRIQVHTDSNHNPAMDIIDDGPGIADALLDQILEPFFTRAADGTGLGLYLARELCEANGASLSPIPCTQGACFRIQLP
jgi:two-component system sensor histidine kinase PilS (NtrC family)